MEPQFSELTIANTLANLDKIVSAGLPNLVAEVTQRVNHESALLPSSFSLDDLIYGSSGDDQIYGDDSSNPVVDVSNDAIFGGGGSDRISGKLGNDILFGDDGKDVIRGNEGNDVLWGGLGSDRLIGDISGKTGQDVFVLARNGSIDKIIDFQVEVDRLALADDLTFAQIEFAQASSDAIIKDKSSGERIARLKGVNIEDLSDRSFVSVQISSPESNTVVDSVTVDSAPSQIDLTIGLYEASTDTLIQEIKDGDKISADALQGKNVTIVASVLGESSLSKQAESILLNLNEGQITKTENIEPYAIFGDAKGDLHGEEIAFNDVNIITLQVYSENNRQGELLGTVSRQFSIADSSTAEPDAPTAADQWLPLNEPGSGGRIDSIAVSPYDSDVVLVGGDILSTHRSTNQGEDWSATSGWANYEIADFTWHPTEKNIVWAGSLSGPHLSTDGGKTWTVKREGLPEIASSKYSAPAEKILFDPDSGNLLAFGGDHRQLKSPSSVLNYGAVWSSQDGGETWSRRSTVVENGNVMDVTYAGSSNQTIYSAVWEHGFFRSDDDGQTWQRSNQGLPQSDGKVLATSLTVHPDNADIAWVTIQDGGIYKTTSGGESWTGVNQGLPSGRNQFWSIEVAADGETLYAGNKDYLNQPGVYKSTDAGESWTRVFSSNAQIEGGDRAYPGGINPWWVEVDPNDADTVYAGTDNAVYRSVNGGETWSHLNAKQAGDGWTGSGFSGLVSRNVEWNPYNPDHLIVQGMDGAKALQSWDGGQTWRVDNPGLPNYSGGHDVAFTPDWMFGVFGQHGDDTELIARSRDEGRSWTLLESPVSPSEAKHLHVDPRNPDRLWMVVGEQLWFTENATQTTQPEWTRLTLGSSEISIGDIEADPRNGSAFYVGTDKGVYRTTDGSTFDFIGGPAAGRKIELNISPSDPDILYATSDDSYWGDYGIWRYDASQNAWERLWQDDRNVSSRIGDLAVHPNNPNHLALITNDHPYHDETWATGVWISKDAGETWTQHNTGLPMLRGDTIAFAPDGTHLVVGLGGAGFYKTEFAL